MLSGSIQVVTNGRISFFLCLNSIPLCVYVYVEIYLSFFIHLSVDGYLFPCLNYCTQCCNEWGVQKSFLVVISFSLEIYPRSGIVELYGSFIFNFLRSLHTIKHSSCTNLHSHQQCTTVSFSSTSLLTFVISCFS